MMRKKSKKGFSLVETLVAVSIVVFAILGPVTLTSVSLKASSAGKNNLIAGNLAQEAIELIRARSGGNVISGGNDNWLSGMGNPEPPGTICFGSSGCSIDAYDLNPQSCSAGPGGCQVLRFDGVYNHQPPTSSNEATIFTRVIRITDINPEIEVRIIVTVSWTERFGSQAITVSENMLNWQ